MKKFFVPISFLLIILLFVVINPTQAQDTVKKTTVIKKTTVKPVVVNPAAAKAIPINPKTGRPYTKYGYGYYSKNKYDATKAARKADSLKRAASVSPPVAPAVATTAPDTTQAPVVQTDKSLSGQYQYLLTKIYYNQRPYVDAIWKNFMDTLNTSRNQLKDAQEKLAERNKTITGLQSDVSNRDQSLASTDTISFLGIAFDKTTYNLIMWGLVIIFGVLAAVVFARIGSYKHEAMYRTTLYSELEEEFKSYKAKANEKEKKLARELQTERNKVDELMGRG